MAATDGLDGYLARSRGEVTNFGKFIDPLADKILVAAALLALIELGVLPSWVALVILTREFIVSGIRMVAASQGVVIAASWYGKAKTVAQIVAIVLFIVKDSVVITDPQGVLHNPLYLVSWLAMLIALALTVISMLDYFVKAKEILGFAPSGKRAKRRAGAGEAAAADAGEDEAGGRALSAQEAASISPEALDELAGRVSGGTPPARPSARPRAHGRLAPRRSPTCRAARRRAVASSATSDEARRVGREPRDARLDRGGHERRHVPWPKACAALGCDVAGRRPARRPGAEPGAWAPCGSGARTRRSPAPAAAISRHARRRRLLAARRSSSPRRWKRARTDVEGGTASDRWGKRNPRVFGVKVLIGRCCAGCAPSGREPAALYWGCKLLSRKCLTNKHMFV
ncbi:MAG: CDP-diacylglycerol--glycerol-3-phosphate 3-phosphatidyltransferase [Eggerthella lenta]